MFEERSRISGFTIVVEFEKKEHLSKRYVSLFPCKFVSIGQLPVFLVKKCVKLTVPAV